MKPAASVPIFMTLCIVLSSLSLLRAQDRPADKPVQIDEKAEKVLRDMAAFYKGVESMSLTANVSMTRTFQGQTQSAGASVAYAMQRPNKLSIQPAAPNQPRVGTIMSDGETLHTYVPSMSKYTAGKAPETFAPIVNNRVLDVLAESTLSLVGSLIVDDPYAAVLEGVENATYVGLEKQGDAELHRIRLSTGEITNDIFVAAGDKPLLVKVVPDHSATEARAKEAGQELSVDMALTLEDYQLDPQLAAETFAFNAPAGAEKVASFFEEPAHPLEGKPAPAFTLASLEGKQVSLAQHKGKDVVILDFWATWCGPCVQAMPILTSVADQYKDKNVVLYGINQREGQDVIKKFLEQRKLELNVLLDSDGAVAGNYAVRGIPQTVIIDKEGNIAAVHVGFSPALRQQLTSKLEELTTPKSAE